MSTIYRTVKDWNRLFHNYHILWFHDFYYVLSTTHVNINEIIFPFSEKNQIASQITRQTIINIIKEVQAKCPEILDKANYFMEVFGEQMVFEYHLAF